MSRLTASPFHKPSPFEFPRGPLSPPDTNTDTVVGSGLILPASNHPAVQDSGSLDTGIQSAHDSPLRGKKSSSIPYHNTSFRESKERAIQRNNVKSLIIVMPPSTLLQGYGPRGQTVTNGPFHRLTQGIVMPILPSMFGQLTAIAREFSFPSTLGLCLYLHYVEDGVTLTPRISDDSWQSLWGHLSDPPLANERRPLICGKIEFDIDLRAARWYGSWVSAIHREISEHSNHAYPVTAPSHFRGESSLVGGRHFDEDMADNTIQQNSAPIGRHVPKKLSLVERFDVASVRSEHRHNSRSVAASTEFVAGQQVLSTIVQEDEPKSGRQQLDNLVKSWRASALISPSPLAAKGQPSLDAVYLPNDVPIDTPDEIPGSPAVMRLEDYTWSVSSEGPLSIGELSPVSWVHAPSVHIADRLPGSVCTSASICTSFGFVEDDNYSYVSNETRVPSVHLAERLRGSVCSSPLTCTSFGPDDDVSDIYHTSFNSRVPTPDIAHRFYEDCPPTPMTATSWGAPLSYPPSPRCVSPALSLDLGERARFHDQFETMVHYPRSKSLLTQESIETNGPWEHVWPFNSDMKASTSASDTVPWAHVWPFNIQTKDNLEASSISAPLPWKHVWPYNEEVENNASLSSIPVISAWPHVWPFNSQSTNVNIPPLMPANGAWEHVWPFNSEYMHSTGLLQEDKILLPHNKEITKVTSASATASGPWLHVWPYNSSSKPSNMQHCASVYKPSSFGYPYINQPVYPHIELYPTLPGELSIYNQLDTMQDIVVELPVLYPMIQLYVPVYPHNLSNIYPETIFQAADPCSKAQVEVPFSDTCYTALHCGAHTDKTRSQYPHFDIYPDITNQSSEISIPPSFDRPLHTTVIYPTFNLYPAIYPYFDLYPCVHEAQRETVSLLTEPMPTYALSPVLLTQYPSFNLYPKVYPYFDIYPAAYDAVAATIETGTTQDFSLSPTLPTSYPFFNIYPSLYPDFVIYPAAHSDVGTAFAEPEPERSLSPILRPMYPSFNLYPKVYPYLEIYPPSYAVKVDNVDSKYVELDHRITKYPYFILYPGVYPYFDIYPAPYPSLPLDHISIPSSTAETRTWTLPYPFFNLYPAVYPNFDLYLPLPDFAIQQPNKPSKINNSRLTHLELHAMVMMEKAQAKSRGSFGRLETFLDIPDIDSETPFLGEHEDIDHYFQEKSISRNIRISTVPIPNRGVRRLTSASAKSENISLFDSPTESDQSHTNFYGTSPSNVQDRGFSKISNVRGQLGYQDESTLYRTSLNIHDRSITRSSSLREPQGKPPIPPKPQFSAPRRRDSLVLQRVKALDNHVAENSTVIPRETLLKFPMPPRAFPPLPPLPQDRGH
ncbi:hypothetical protein JR316_0004790 [Psilocybe cubensis]|uniref:Uncharacterized protein n=2 Tax=Psilocybe cubensis TaxID=181762 RepID=A0A8H8CKY0_PSICU|nr:hypothetical protein JR316_0004790 [Psilocybe cubensis]KAH9482690.1 hypothetical protein JR316_0004790 [Psilocybe cubensis]